MKQHLVKAFSWVLTANLARQVSFLVVNAILFERLSRSTFGALTLAFGYMLVFAGFGEFGVRQIGWRDIARDPEHTTELSGLFFGARTVSTSITMLAYLALMPVLWNRGLPPVIYLVYVLGIFFNGGTFDFPLFGRNRVDLYARYSLLGFGAYLLGCVLLVTSDARAWIVPALFASSMGLMFILELRWFHSNHGRLMLDFRASQILGVYRESWPLGLSETLNRVAANYPLILIGLVLGSAGVANYRIAELAYSFLAQLGLIFATAAFSHMAHMYQHQRSALRHTVVRMLAIAVVGSLLAGAALALVAPIGYRMAFGSLAPQTVSVLRLLGLALVFAGPVRFLRSLLASIDRQQILLTLSAVEVAIGVILGSLMMRTKGIAGMAIGVAVSETLTFLILLMVYRRTLRLAE
ncbi:MAG: oligosaccharide flippase family protein [Thermoanaerobaculia bacterium]